jgi:hypothetical protein
MDSGERIKTNDSYAYTHAHTKNHNVVITTYESFRSENLKKKIRTDSISECFEHSAGLCEVKVEGLEQTEVLAKNCGMPPLSLCLNMYMYMYMDMYSICICICICVCVCVCIYIYIYRIYIFFSPPKTKFFISHKGQLLIFRP